MPAERHGESQKQSPCEGGEKPDRPQGPPQARARVRAEPSQAVEKGPHSCSGGRSEDRAVLLLSTMRKSPKPASLHPTDRKEYKASLVFNERVAT